MIVGKLLLLMVQIPSPLQRVNRLQKHTFDSRSLQYFSPRPFFWLGPPLAPLVVVYTPQGSSRGLPTEFRCEPISSATRFVLRDHLAKMFMLSCRVLSVKVLEFKC